MKENVMKKRVFSFLSIVIIFSMLVSCAPQPVVQTVEVEKIVKETVQVEKVVQETVQVEVEKMVLAGAVPYPEAPLMTGMREPVTFEINEMIEFKKFDQYCEPDWVKALVDQGKLPPVEERLPDEPFVYKTGFMSDGLGEYGGVWRGVWAAPTEGWNWMAGVSQGWFGIEAIVQEEPLMTGPMFLTKNVEPLPQLAKSWEWSSDGKQLTMHLVEGAKWSDGDPFDAEDIMFFWEDNILDAGVNSWTQASFWEIEGEPISLEKVDDYTIRWTFPVAYPFARLYDMTSLVFSPGPSHILKPLHPKHGGADYQAYRDALPPNKLPIVTMGPWVPVEYKTDEFMVMRRNPYYWKVDENGCQLPYLDEVQWTYSKSGVTRTLNTIAGTADHANVENPETFDETVKQASNSDAPFRVEWGPETLGFNLEFNMSKDHGVKDDRDAAVRELLRDPRFRRALSQAIDREGIARSLTNGPFFRAWPGGLFPGSQYFDRASTVFYPFSPDTSRGILAEMGLKDTDNDGILNWAEGPMAGKNIDMAITANEDQSAGAIIGPALVLLFQDIGIKVNFRLITASVANDNTTNGTWEMHISRPGQAWATPNVRCRDIAPIAKEFGWNREGEKPRELQPYEEEMVRLANAFCLEPDVDKQKELMAQYQRIHTENVYSAGIVVGRYGLMLNKYFKNVPIGTPPFLYQWDFNNFLPEQIWLPTADQTKLNQTEIYSGKLPGVDFMYPNFSE
jgi:peptide/nickel transport system substrate-binding protein